MAKKESKENNPTKIEILKQGKQTEFWKLILDAIEESREYITDQLEDESMDDLPPEQYKFMVKTLQSKKKFLDVLKKTPDNLISWLETPPSERPKNFDPYEE